jgi:autotransporter-associated beta strand protein
VSFISIGSDRQKWRAVLIGGDGGELIKVGPGTLTLLGTNTYSGGTTFIGGTVAVGRDADPGTNGSIVGDVEDNGTLIFNHGMSAASLSFRKSNLPGNMSISTQAKPLRMQ